jgi:hypothetical protein
VSDVDSDRRRLNPGVPGNFEVLGVAGLVGIPVVHGNPENQKFSGVAAVRGNLGIFPIARFPGVCEAAEVAKVSRPDPRQVSDGG